MCVLPTCSVPCRQLCGGSSGLGWSPCLRMTLCSLPRLLATHWTMVGGQPHPQPRPLTGWPSLPPSLSLSLDQPPSQLDMMYGWPYDLDALPSFYLRPTVAQPAFARVLTAVTYTHADTVVCPLLPALTRLLLHFVEEWECYAMLDKLLCRRAWLDQSPSELAASRATFRNLCLSHEVKTLCVCAREVLCDIVFLFLSVCSGRQFSRSSDCAPRTCPRRRSLPPCPSTGTPGPSTDSPSGWWWVTSALSRAPAVPASFCSLQVRVVDMYLVEGPKVLYRLGLAALQLFAAHHQTAG